MINLINQGLGGGGQVGLGTTPKPAEVPLPLPVHTAPQVALPLPQPAQVNDQAIQDIQRKRADLLRQSIAEALPRFFMPVSDVKFTIYKDSTGQYITRFTNLVSGEIQQIPEPELLNMLTSGGGGQINFIQTSA